MNTKKILLFIFSVLFLFGCNPKNKPIIGEKKDIILNENQVKLSIEKEEITLSDAQTFKNYYGDNSTLNDNIENYTSNSFVFDSFKISRKKFGVKSYYFSNPIIVDNIMYILDTKGNLVAKNLNNLKENLWEIKIIERDNTMNYYGGKISFYNDTIFISTRLNKVLAVSKDGNLKWEKKLNSIPISTPVIENNTMYVITNDNKLYALDSDNGKIKWIHYGNNKDSAIIGSANPVIYKDYIIASYSSGELFVIDKKNGTTIFNTNLTGKYFTYSSFELTDIDSTPVIKNNILIATANNGITAGIDLKSMNILWKQNLASLSNILVNNNHIFLMTNDNNLVCLNIKSGKINWITEVDKYTNMKKKKGNIYYKSLIFSNNELIAFNNIDQYKIFNPIDGELKNTNKIKYSLLSVPFSLNNKLYSIVEKGKNIRLIIQKDL